MVNRVRLYSTITQTATSKAIEEGQLFVDLVDSPRIREGAAFEFEGAQDRKPTTPNYLSTLPRATTRAGNNSAILFELGTTLSSCKCLTEDLRSFETTSAALQQSHAVNSFLSSTTLWYQA